jgi:hypothetical protein
VIPFIKNKLRFVTVSLLFASLVTVISSASAENLDFELTVESCGDSEPGWEPAVNSYIADSVLHGVDGPISISASQGSTVEMEIRLGWIDGSVDCGTPVGPDGNVTGIFRNLPIGFSNDAENSISSETVPAGTPTINDYFDIPYGADPGVISGWYELTWTP